MINISDLNDSELYSLENEIQRVKENRNKVYLYILREDRIEELCGNLRIPYNGAIYCGIRVPTNDKKFCKCYEVKNMEGLVYNRSVWLSEPNIEKAKSALLEYELEKLNQWKEQVKKSEKRIKIIKGDN